MSFESVLRAGEQLKLSGRGFSIALCVERVVSGPVKLIENLEVEFSFWFRSIQMRTGKH